MKFELLDRYMRRFELERLYTFPPEMYVVIQLIGHDFPSLYQRRNFLMPYDEGFQKHMLETAQYLMEKGLSIIYGYTSGEEISLLIHKNMDNFGRMARRLNFFLAGEASGKLSLLLGEVVSFEARPFQLPHEECVFDYFLWRREDGNRKAIHRYCHHLLSKEGLSADAAAQKLAKMDIKSKENLIKKHYPSSSLPAWHTRGSGLIWESYQQEGFNPKTEKKIEIWRKRIKMEENLPEDKNAYREFLSKRL